MLILRDVPAKTEHLATLLMTFEPSNSQFINLSYLLDIEGREMESLGSDFLFYFFFLSYDPFSAPAKDIKAKYLQIKPESSEGHI